MSLSVSRMAEPLRFDVGIGSAGYADVIDSPVAGQPQRALLPGSTTVSQAIDELFPADRSVSGGLRYEYRVCCITADTYRNVSAFSAANGLTYLTVPDMLLVRSVSAGVRVMWAASEGAERYRLQRRVFENERWSPWVTTRC